MIDRSDDGAIASRGVRVQMSIQFMCVCVCVSSTVVIVANCTLALTQWGVLSDYVLGMGAISNPRAIVIGMDFGGPNA